MKHSLLIFCAAMLPVAAVAQSEVDAYQLSQTELRGTARFMSMAGAFTALGGDLSTLHQNPAGIGIYRSNEIGITFDLNFNSATTKAAGKSASDDLTHFDVNNVGYVGTLNIGDDLLQTVSWGISYSRVNSFQRNFRANGMPLESSLSNSVALMTDGIAPEKIDGSNAYNSDYNWLSILAFQGGMITPTKDQNNNVIYDGLWQHPIFDNNGQVEDPGTSGYANAVVRQRGYTDEYSINFGGNLSNTVYWGLGLGITDLSFEENTIYEEFLDNANIPVQGENYGIEPGNCDYGLYNWKRISGTGVNFKIGAIVKPINELRFGIAVHTPTFYSLNTQYQGTLDFGASNGFVETKSTDYADYNWNLRSPWRMMVGVAGVIGGRGILSLDYEYQGWNDMKTSDDYGDFNEYNDAIKEDFKGSSTIRLGAELRVTPQFSLRAGYSYSEGGVQAMARDSEVQVLTGGTQPSYTLNKATNLVTFGAGARFGGFYADLAYVYAHHSSTYYGFAGFTDYDGAWSKGPTAKLSDNRNQIVLSLGYKF